MIIKFVISFVDRLTLPLGLNFDFDHIHQPHPLPNGVIFCHLSTLQSIKLIAKAEKVGFWIWCVATLRGEIGW